MLVHRPLIRLTTTAFLSTRNLHSTTALRCQLLGINAETPTQFSDVWSGFCERGGKTDIHADGWGLAYYNEQHKLLQIRGTDAAASSPLAEQVGRRNIQTHNLLAHIRYATQGAVDHKNVHPFSRTLWGEEWSFGHNEDVPVIPSTRRGPFAPQGGTDSEAMFCTILNGLSERFGSEKPASSAISRVVHMDRKGTILNFLLTCGPSQQWAYSWPGQRPGSKTWNGLHYSTSSNMCMFATKPVTDSSNWVEMEPHELIQVCHGVMQRVR